MSVCDFNFILVEAVVFSSPLTSSKGKIKSSFTHLRIVLMAYALFLYSSDHKRIILMQNNLYDDTQKYHRMVS